MACQQSETKSGPLFIRYNGADAGARPINPCTGFWSSPDVWIEGGIDAGTAQVGVPNTVRVRVRALPKLPGGAPAIENVNVQVWVSDFTTSIGPLSGRPSAGGAAGLTGFIASISAGSSGVASCGPWTPDASDAALNGGHLCLAANCFGDPPDDGTQVPPNSFYAIDGSSKVCCDSHLAQRNIAVRATDGDMDFDMLIWNHDEERQRDFEIEIAPITGRLEFGAAERRLLLSSPAIRRLEVGGRERRRPGRGLSFEDLLRHEARGPMRLGLGGVRKDVPLRRTRRRAPFYLESEFGEGTAVKTTLEPGKSAQIRVHVGWSPDDPRGSMRSFDITQRIAGGDLVGGATLHAILTR